MNLPDTLLLSFVRDHVVNNIHIIDHEGLTATWVKHCVQKLLPPNVLTRELVEKGGWSAIAQQCVEALPLRYQSVLCSQLKDLISTAYPKALKDPGNVLCVIAACQEKRQAPAPACLAHTCSYCAQFISPFWRKTHRLLVSGEVGISFGTDVKAHLVPPKVIESPDTDHVLNLCRLTWEISTTYANLICFGDLRPCAAYSNTSYNRSEDCRGEMCIPRIIYNVGEEKDIFKFCRYCWPLNICRFGLGFKDAHTFDAVDPVRREARVCANDNCNQSRLCIACQKQWFVSRACRPTYTPVLCTKCHEERLCCAQCHRLSWRAVPGIFFATRWIYPDRKPVPKGGKEHVSYCIDCLPKIPRPLNYPRDAHRQEAVRALVIGWRTRIRAERAWFETNLAKDAHATIRLLLEPVLSSRERALARRQPDFFWNAVVIDCTLWDSTWWLMYQTAQLPKDVFLIVLRMVCFGKKGLPAPSEQKKKR